MANDYRNRTVLCLDQGLFVELAVLLARSFKKVFYYSPWTSAYPHIAPTLVGTGLPNVTRVNDFWQVIDEVDLVFCPDIYTGGLQEHLVKMGKRVWGSRMGEKLELDRAWAKERMDAVGIDVGPYKVVCGLDALREYLKFHKNQYVKISAVRGMMETFHSPSYSIVEPRLDELERTLGPWKHHMEFIVEEAIDDAVEIAYDGICIDGKFPKNVMWGIEIKDTGFVLQTKPYSKLPESIIETNEAIAPMLAKYQYRGAMSNELRVTKGGRAYAIDFCARFGSPCNELQQVMVANWPDIIWEGAGGVIVEPEFTAKWGAEAMLKSEWALTNWMSIGFPKSIRDNVKIHHLAVIDGKSFFVPECQGSSTVGAVVATGDTMDEAIKNVREIADKVEGFYIKCDLSCFDEAKDEFAKLNQIGATRGALSAA